MDRGLPLDDIGAKVSIEAPIRSFPPARGANLGHGARDTHKGRFILSAQTRDGQAKTLLVAALSVRVRSQPIYVANNAPLVTVLQCSLACPKIYFARLARITRRVSTQIHANAYKILDSDGTHPFQELIKIKKTDGIEFYDTIIPPPLFES